MAEPQQDVSHDTEASQLFKTWYDHLKRLGLSLSYMGHGEATGYLEKAVTAAQYLERNQHNISGAYQNLATHFADTLGNPIKAEEYEKKALEILEKLPDDIKDSEDGIFEYYFRKAKLQINYVQTNVDFLYYIVRSVRYLPALATIYDLDHELTKADLDHLTKKVPVETTPKPAKTIADVLNNWLAEERKLREQLVLQHDEDKIPEISSLLPEEKVAERLDEMLKIVQQPPKDLVTINNLTDPEEIQKAIVIWSEYKAYRERWKFPDFFEFKSTFFPIPDAANGKTLSDLKRAVRDKIEQEINIAKADLERVTDNLSKVTDDEYKEFLTEEIKWYSEVLLKSTADFEILNENFDTAKEHLNQTDATKDDSSILGTRAYLAITRREFDEAYAIFETNDLWSLDNYEKITNVRAALDDLEALLEHYANQVYKRQREILARKIIILYLYAEDLASGQFD